jgi:hypothetical protein
MLPVKEDLALDSATNGYSEMIRLIKGGIGAMHRGYFSAKTVIFLWMQLRMGVSGMGLFRNISATAGIFHECG